MPARAQPRLGGTAVERPARVAELMAEFNAPDTSAARHQRLLASLLGTPGGVVVRAPLSVTLGQNVHFEDGCFVDAGCTFGDAAEIRVGAFTQIARSVVIETVTPAGPCPVRIGRNVWIGAGAVIAGGVSVGDDVIVVAGAVVVSDVPEGSTIAGNPARRVG